ncbi:MAG: SGNH/GDSL hydrolase family protein [Candidatus Binatia bacterium]
MSRTRQRIAVALAVLVVSLLACEVVLRVATRRDETGQLWLGSLRLLPYELPLDVVRANLDKLREGATFLAWDADLGWAPRPHGRSAIAPFAVNGAAIRSDREIPEGRTSGTLRIATFGDSFTFGDEVGPEETWESALERTLAERGVAAEVLNFGVSAYGIDQAYLRWRRDGRRFRPDVVLFGFQAENALRDRNVFRPLYFTGTEVPLSKPRFVVRGDDLELKNVPVLPADAVLPALETMPANPLFAYEGFYAPFARHWWLASRLVAFAASVRVSRESAMFRLDPEARELARRLVARFAADVTADGAAFVVVHLPRREDLAAKLAGREVWYAPLLQDLASLGVVEPTASVASDDAALFAPRGHYAPALNAIVGAALAEPVQRAAGRQARAAR